MFDLRELDKELLSFSSLTAFKADLEETDDAYLLTIDVPGVNKEDITINLEDEVLTVSFKNEAKEENKEKYLLQEIVSSYNYSRGFLVKNADEDAVKAKLENGVLAVVIAKKIPPKPLKKIISIE